MKILRVHCSYDLLGTILTQKLIQYYSILYIPVIVMYIGRQALGSDYNDIVLVS